MTDEEELDALVAYLRELATYYEVATEAASAITTLRAQLAEAREQTALGMVDVMATAAKEAREKALREAAQVLTDEIDLARIAMPQVVPILAADRKAILALIEKSDAR